MRINWDKERWTDPHLIEQHLRVPDAMLDEHQALRMAAVAERIAAPRKSAAMATPMSD